VVIEVSPGRKQLNRVEPVRRDLLEVLPVEATVVVQVRAYPEAHTENP
jgi:hypothetical protein